MNDLLRYPIEYRWITLMVILFTVGISAAGFKDFRIETDYEIFFDGTNERLEALRQIEGTFGRRDTVQFSLDFGDESAFSRKNLAINRELTEAAWQIPHSRRVDSLTNFAYTQVDGDDFDVSELYDNIHQLSDEDIEQRRQFALQEPALANAFSKNQKVSGVIVWVNLPVNDSEATHQVAEYILDMAEDFQALHPNIKLYVSGSVLLSEAFFQESTTGLGILLLTAFVLFIVLAGLQLRSLNAVFCIITTVIFSIITALGLSTWIDIPFTAPSSSVPVIVCAISIANIVHIITNFQQRYIRTGKKADSIYYALAINARPITITSLTTLIGFLCLNFSQVPPYRMLGNVAAIGTAVVYVYTFTLLPALLSFTRKVSGTAEPDNVSGFWQSLGAFVISKKNGLLVVNLLLIVSLTPFVLENKIDDRLVNYFSKTTQIRSHSDFAMENLAPFYGISYAVRSSSENGIHHYEYLKGLDDFTSWLRSQPEVMYVSSWSDTIKRINKNMHSNDASWYRVPEDAELASQYSLLYELSLPFGLDLTNMIDINRSQTKVYVGLHNISSSTMRAFESRAEHWIEQNLPAYMQAKASGPPLLFAHIWDSATRSNLMGMLLAILLVSLILAFALKSASLGLISLIPNLLPIILTFGIWGLIDGEINIASSIIAVITFGIVVDDTVHFLSKYQYALSKGMCAQDAIKYTFQKVGRALFITTVTLIAGFSVLCLSPFLLNHAMGLLSALAFSIALTMDFLLLPALLLWLQKENTDKAEPIAA